MIGNVGVVVGYPALEVLVPVVVEVDPEFLFVVVADTRVFFVVETIEGPTDDVAEVVVGDLFVDELALLEEFADVGPGAHPQRQPGRSISDQGQDGDVGGPFLLEQNVFPRLGVALSLAQWGYTHLDIVLQRVAPLFLRVLVPLSLLSPIVLNPL